jgi:hypothetical protein
MKTIYTSFYVQRLEKGPDKEWVLIMGYPKDNKRFPFQGISGLSVRFWYGHGCLGARNWDHRVIGDATSWMIDTQFLNNPVDFVFLDILNRFVRQKDQSLEDFDKHVETYLETMKSPKGYLFEKIVYDIGNVRKWEIERGYFEDGIWCG